MNYTYIIKSHVERLELRLSPVDDNIVEADETYSLIIVIVDSHNRVVTGENKTTTITIYDDDGKQLCNYNSLVIIIILLLQPKHPWY